MESPMDGGSGSLFSKEGFMRRCIFVLVIAVCGTAKADPLGSYNIDPSKITVSGVSSGAFMAVQLHVAYSSLISGAGSIAGGIYWCAEGDSTRAQTTCMFMPQTIQSADSIKKANELAAAGSIDPVSNLAGHPVYIYASPKDYVVNPGNSDKLVEFYKAFVDPSLIRTEHGVASAHGIPTLNNGNPCDMTAAPWIIKCNYDAAGELLKTIYGTLQSRGTAVPDHLIQFTQSDFGDASTPLYSYGWVYVPADCAAGGRCGLHVVFHGCTMNPESVQDQVPRLSGYDEWAETNHLVVLYPQSAKLGSVNPDGCWDWFGFTGPNYMTKSGPQMVAIKKMLDRLTAASH